MYVVKVKLRKEDKKIMAFVVNSDVFIRYRNIKRDIKNKCINIKKIIPYFINNPIPIRYKYPINNTELNHIAPKYNPKLFVKISPHYGFEMGYCKGNFNNHRVMTFLCKDDNTTDNRWVRIKYGTYNDATVVSHLRAVFMRNDNGKKYINKKFRMLLSKDTLRIYDMTDSNGYDVNWRFYRKNDLKNIIKILKGLRISERVLGIILRLSNHYPGKYCMDMWLEWLYLAMIAEFFPKKPHPNDVYTTATGKCVKALGIYQSLYRLDMRPSKVAHFSKHKHAKYLNDLTRRYLKQWNHYVNKSLLN